MHIFVDHRFICDTSQICYHSHHHHNTTAQVDADTTNNNNSNSNSGGANQTASSPNHWHGTPSVPYQWLTTIHGTWWPPLPPPMNDNDPQITTNLHPWMTTTYQQMTTLHPWPTTTTPQMTTSPMWMTTTPYGQPPPHIQATMNNHPQMTPPTYEWPHP